MAETKLCVKKSAAVRNGSIRLGRVITSSTGSCPAGTRAVLATDTAHDARISTLEDVTRVQNVVRVGVAGGDFTSIASAISSLVSPSTSNPYLVIAGPGTFTLAATLTIPGGVTLRGAGIDRTIVAAATNSVEPTESAVLQLADGAAIENLTVKNTSTSNSLVSTGVYISGITEANQANIDTVIRDVRVTLSAGGPSEYQGIFIENADLVIVRSLIDVDGASANNGIDIRTSGADNSTVHIHDSNIYAGSDSSSPGTFSRGVIVSNSGLGGHPEVFIHNTKIYGQTFSLIVHDLGSKASVFHSVLSSNAVSGVGILLTGAVVVNNSSIDAFDNVSNGGGTLSCAFVTEVGGGGYASTCE